jgi:hypothetical protein
MTLVTYRLLKLQLGLDVNVLKDRIGDLSTNVGNKPWQRGLVTVGVWREDDEDVIYKYSKSNPPTLTGIAGSI